MAGIVMSRQKVWEQTGRVVLAEIRESGSADKQWYTTEWVQGYPAEAVH